MNINDGDRIADFPVESSQFTNEINESTCGNLENQLARISINSTSIASETEMKTIKLTEYENLLQMIPEIERLKKTIKRMEDKIKHKDKLLNQMNDDWERAKNNGSTTRDPTTVSKSNELL